MKILIFATLLLGLLLECQSAIFLKRQREIPGHPGQCYDMETHTFYKAGEEMIWRGKECARKLCRGPYGRKTVLIEHQTCGKMAVSPNCIISNDMSQSYPDCCQVVCVERNDDSNFV